MIRKKPQSMSFRDDFGSIQGSCHCLSQMSSMWPRQGSQNLPVITLNSTHRDAGPVTAMSSVVTNTGKNIQQAGTRTDFAHSANIRHGIIVSCSTCGGSENLHEVVGDHSNTKCHSGQACKPDENPSTEPKGLRSLSV